MTKYTITGKTIEGNFQGKPFTSCSKHDLPTGERITITIDGIEYERTIFERIKWRNMGENTLIARFVIVNGVQYEVAEAEELQVLADVASDYDGYIVNGEQFKTLAEADAYIVEKGLTLPDDEREAFEIHEWPDGTWLGIRCHEPEAIEPAFELADFEVMTKEDILNMDCNYNIEGETAYRLLRGTDSCIISFAQGEWCAEYSHWYYDADGEMVEDYLEDFFGDAPYKVCDKASAYAVKVMELIKAERRD